MNFRLGTNEDLNEICEVLKEVVKNKDKGMNWSELYPNREVFQGDIDNKHLYVLENKEILGVVVLNSIEDPNYKNIIWENNENYLVIHRIFTSYKVRGEGYGKLLIEKSIEVAKENNLKSIRLDTFSENISAQEFYKKRGFKYVGTVNLQGKPGDFYCYELLL